MSAVAAAAPLMSYTAPAPLKCLSQPCSRVRWLCDELGIPYDLEKANLQSASMYLKIAPHDDPSQRTTLLAPIMESGAVLMHITSTYGNGRLSIPPSDPRFQRYLRWIWACEGGAMMLIDQYQELSHAAPSARRELMLVRLRSTAFDLFAHADLAMRGQEFIMGSDFTVADIMLCHAVATVVRCGLLRRNEVPYLAAYVDRLQRRPACKLSAV